MCDREYIITRLRRNFLWGIFISTVIVYIIDAAGHLLQWGLVETPFINFLTYTLPVFLLICHATWVLDLNRGLCFVLIASLIGFLAEVISLHYATLFGGRYMYLGDGVKLFEIPLKIPIFWAVVVYLGYSLTTSFHYSLNKNKPSRHTGGATLLPLLILLDGLFVVSIDLLLDPVQVHTQQWTWLDEGAYFGIPIGNFLGWFLVTTVTTGLFRTFEYFWPQKKHASDKWAHLMPGVCYGVLYIMLVLQAFRIQLPELALIGSLVMGPILILNLIFFACWQPARSRAKRCFF